MKTVNWFIFGSDNGLSLGDGKPETTFYLLSNGQASVISNNTKLVIRENICDTIKCLLFLFKSGLTMNIQGILLL